MKLILAKRIELNWNLVAIIIMIIIMITLYKRAVQYEYNFRYRQT